jgi:hypothetical protein
MKSVYGLVGKVLSCEALMAFLQVTIMGFCANADSSFSGCALLPSFCCWTAEQSKIGVMHYFIPSIGS